MAVIDGHIHHGQSIRLELPCTAGRQHLLLLGVIEAGQCEAVTAAAPAVVRVAPEDACCGSMCLCCC